jgi:hypothetical protein
MDHSSLFVERPLVMAHPSLAVERPLVMALPFPLPWAVVQVPRASMARLCQRPAAEDSVARPDLVVLEDKSALQTFGDVGSRA